jgi:hypothetical protein
MVVKPVAQMVGLPEASLVPDHMVGQKTTMKLVVLVAMVEVVIDTSLVALEGQVTPLTSQVSQ